MSLNIFTFTGNVVADPEVKYLDNKDSTMVATFRVAVNKIKRDADPLWLTVEAWGKLAETVANYVRKGQKIAVSGSVDRVDTWLSKSSGEPQFKLIVRADRIDLPPKSQSASTTDEVEF